MEPICLQVLFARSLLWQVGNLFDLITPTRKELRRASLVLSDLNFLDDLSDADFDAWCRDTAPGDRRPLSMVNNLGGSSADHDYAVEQEYDSPSEIRPGCE